ncbi:MAG: DUF177 domain-containing protein [Kiritimatiellae bacterium]|nr:DUF177 domain-containing protein [Kiritimatiellia bacterium]MDD4736562.1 DUF177 domain-containing protein [Kiritimatiellia bacterium]
MIIDLTQIGEEGQPFEGEESPEILELEQDHSIRFRGPIGCAVLAQLVSGSLIVQGRVQVEVERECSRCGEFFSTTVQDSSFLRDYAISPDQLQVDITEDIREAVMLHLTRFPLCSRDCKGVCVHCGVNLNFGVCSCEEQEPGGAWGALEQLKLNE